MSLQLDSSLLKKAIRALYGYLERQTSSSSSASAPSTLLNSDDEQFIYLVVALKQVPAKTNNKPLRIPIPHRIFCLNGEDGCLISKDPADLIEAQLKLKPVEGISKVLPISKLRSDYGQYADKRDLCAAYDLFLADVRVIPLLPALLGKTFFEKKKQPVPVILSKKTIQTELETARDSTYFILSKGATQQIKIGRRAFSQAHILENIIAVITGFTKLPPSANCAHSNIQAIFIKTADSMSIPIFQTTTNMHIKEKDKDEATDTHMETEMTNAATNGSISGTASTAGPASASAATLASKKRKVLATTSEGVSANTKLQKSVAATHSQSNHTPEDEVEDAATEEEEAADDDNDANEANAKALSRKHVAKKLKSSTVPLPAPSTASLSTGVAVKIVNSAKTVLSQVKSADSKHKKKTQSKAPSISSRSKLLSE